MTTHNLKIDAVPFNDLLSGVKTAEVRNDDRGFEVGDTVYLTCSDGRTAERNISHIQHGYGLPDGICVLSYTRDVPDVPELVRYDLDYEGGWGEGAFIGGNPDGTYVRYDQAAAMLAVKDETIELLSQHSHDLNIELQEVYERAEAADAELARIKAQVAVGTIARAKYNDADIILFKPYDDGFRVKDGSPLYAATVASEDLKAKVEVLREVLGQVTGTLKIQNGNRHEDINKIITAAEKSLAATEVKS